MSFTFEIKKEILDQEYSREQAYDFISGLVASSAIKDNDDYIIKINNPIISMTIIDMFNQLNLNFKKTRENKNFIILNNFLPNHNVKYANNFFSGIFVGGGSVSDLNSSSYHLELQFFDSKLSSKVKKFLNDYDFNFSEIKRRNNWVLYIKKSEMITNFIRIMQAFNSLMIFENIRINRDFYNQLNRYSNLDAYNQKKIAKACNNFQTMYKFVRNKKLEHFFNDKELMFFKIKFNNMYSSLEELTKKFEKKTKIRKTRSGLNHYIYKLKKIYKQFN